MQVAVPSGFGPSVQVSRFHVEWSFVADGEGSHWLRRGSRSVALSIEFRKTSLRYRGKAFSSPLSERLGGACRAFSIDFGCFR